MYTGEDNICASVVGIVCLTSNLSQHRRHLPRLFAIEYFNENTVYILASSITFVLNFLFDNVILITYRCTYKQDPTASPYLARLLGIIGYIVLMLGQNGTL